MKTNNSKEPEAFCPYGYSKSQHKSKESIDAEIKKAKQEVFDDFIKLLNFHCVVDNGVYERDINMEELTQIKEKHFGKTATDVRQR